MMLAHSLRPSPPSELRADRQDHDRQPDGARRPDRMPFQRRRATPRSADRGGRDQQEGQQRSESSLFLRRDETLGQLLENEKAENNDGGADCQGDAGAPAEEKRARRATAADPDGPDAGSAG